MFLGQQFNISSSEARLFGEPDAHGAPVSWPALLGDGLVERLSWGDGCDESACDMITTIIYMLNIVKLPLLLKLPLHY